MILLLAPALALDVEEPPLLVIAATGMDSGVGSPFALVDNPSMGTEDDLVYREEGNGSVVFTAELEDGRESLWIWQEGLTPIAVQGDPTPDGSGTWESFSWGGVPGRAVVQDGYGSFAFWAQVNGKSSIWAGDGSGVEPIAVEGEGYGWLSSDLQMNPGPAVLFSECSGPNDRTTCTWYAKVFDNPQTLRLIGPGDIVAGRDVVSVDPIFLTTSYNVMVGVSTLDDEGAEQGMVALLDFLGTPETTPFMSGQGHDGIGTDQVIGDVQLLSAGPFFDRALVSASIEDEHGNVVDAGHFFGPTDSMERVLELGSAVDYAPGPLTAVGDATCWDEGILFSCTLGDSAEGLCAWWEGSAWALVWDGKQLENVQFQGPYAGELDTAGGVLFTAILTGGFIDLWSNAWESESFYFGSYYPFKVQGVGEVEVESVGLNSGYRGGVQSRAFSRGQGAVVANTLGPDGAYGTAIVGLNMVSSSGEAEPGPEVEEKRGCRGGSASGLVLLTLLGIRRPRRRGEATGA